MTGCGWVSQLTVIWANEAWVVAWMGMARVRPSWAWLKLAGRTPRRPVTRGRKGRKTIEDLATSRGGDTKTKEAPGVFQDGFGVFDRDLGADLAGVGGDDVPSDEIVAGENFVGEVGGGAEEGNL